MNEIEEIRKRLGVDDVDVRLDAALRLRESYAREHAAESVKLLLEAMKDASWRVRKSAVDVLIEGYPMDGYIHGLTGLLSQGDNAGARNSAMEALVRLGKRATPYLMEAFRTSDVDVRKFIIDIIGEVGDSKALPLLKDAIKDEDENVRASAVEHLGAMKEPSVVAPLIEMLSGDDLWAAYPAVEALGKIGDKRAVDPLIRALEKKTLREPALRALGMLAGSEALEHIVPLIQDRSRAVQHEALIAMEKLYQRGVTETEITQPLKDHFGEKAIEVLLEHAWSSRPDVRMSAILFLGLLKDERVIGPLLDMSSEEEYEEDVKRALVFIGRRDPETLLPFLESENNVIVRFICSVIAEAASGKYFDAMLRLLDHEDGHVRAYAALVLARIGDMRAVEHVKKLLTDPYEDVQEEAVNALAALKDGLDVDTLLRMLDSGDPVLKKNVVILLGAMGSVKALGSLGSAMKDSDVSIRRAVVTALSFFDHEEALNHIKAALGDGDPDIRMAAAQRLGETGEYLEPLLRLLHDPDDRVRVAAVKAMGMIGDESAVGSLVGLLGDDNGFVVTAVLDSLGKLGGHEAMAVLVGALSSKDTEIRRTSIRALSGFPGVEDVILPFLSDNDWATRVAAAETLRGSGQANVKPELERAIDREEDPVVKKALREALDALR